jgi:diguanylate cyclase (GGDEF)-like protein
MRGGVVAGLAAILLYHVANPHMPTFRCEESDLIQNGHIIGERLPSDAVGCRYGGDEFVVAVPESTAARGNRLADDLRQAVHACAPVLAGHSFPAGTLSIIVGVVSASFDGGSAAEEARLGDGEIGEGVFRAADAALYRAKAKGRNQVCVA